MSRDVMGETPQSRLVITTSSVPSTQRPTAQSRMVFTAPQDQPNSARQRHASSSRLDFGGSAGSGRSNRHKRARSASSSVLSMVPEVERAMPTFIRADVRTENVGDVLTDVSADRVQQLPAVDFGAQHLRGEGASADRVRQLDAYVSSGMVRAYWAALLAEECSRFRLDRSLFVLQNWDEQEQMLQLGSYIHVAVLPRDQDHHGIACTCPRWKSKNTCLHASTMSYHLRDMLALGTHVASPLPVAVLLCSTAFLDRLVFSCVGEIGRYLSGKRAIVSLQTTGRWHCQSCRFSPACKHRPHAIAFAIDAKLLDRNDPAANTGGDIPVPPEEIEPDADNNALMQAASRDDGLGSRGCVSHLPIPPPRWCSLPNEPSFTAPKRSYTSLHFPLNPWSRCSCGQDLHSSNVISPTFTRPATLFDVTMSKAVTIEVVSCPLCRHARRQIGPDLSEFGLFNWNNRFVFAHDVLNTFTNMFTASETPFTAFCLVMRRTYMDHGPDQVFCSDDTFIRVWFAFIRLQGPQLGSTMTCPTCGPSPSIVIADGVSLAPHISKLTSRVCPPTTTTPRSERLETISSHKAQRLPAIKEPALRSLIKKFLEATKTQTAVDAVDLRPIAEPYPALYSFLQLYCRNGPHSPHFKSFRTLLDQIIAPDIILQLVPYAAISILRNVSTGQDFDANNIPDWLQRHIPAMGHVINSLRSSKSPVPLELFALAGWLADRANDVYSRLALHGPGPILSDLGTDTEWQQTGTCYGLPPIRLRRTYPKLRYDNSPTDRNAEDKADGNCKKYYSTYSKSTLAGGIMVLWCTHSICLGFHTMPIAEGRNDVFSAIYTRFEKAPEIIIYDFACQLAAYSFVREARYFQNTRFLIDELHAHGHSGCGQASFASNSMLFDERIRGINTSAAECGNKGIKRIRKTVSFMTYEHAVLFTKVFMDIWNRTIQIRMSNA